MTKLDSIPHPEQRVAIRVAGKLISFRIEVGNLEEVDRMARAQGIDRSKWIRNAILKQLVQERIMEQINLRDADLGVVAEKDIAPSRPGGGLSSTGEPMMDWTELEPLPTVMEEMAVPIHEPDPAPIAAFDEPVVRQPVPTEAPRPNRWG